MKSQIYKLPCDEKNLYLWERENSYLEYSSIAYVEDVKHVHDVDLREIDISHRGIYVL